MNMCVVCHMGKRMFFKRLDSRNNRLKLAGLIRDDIMMDPEGCVGF